MVLKMGWRDFGAKRSKYGNRKTEVDGEVFDSRKEADDYAELKFQQRRGLITDLRRQVPFLLIEAQYDADGKLLERKCEYVADFVWVDCKTGETVVADTKTKGTVTAEYIIKRKLMLKKYGVRIRQI